MTASADRLATLLPRPLQVEARSGTFELDRDVALDVASLPATTADRVVRAFDRLPVRLAVTAAASGATGRTIHVRVDPARGDPAAYRIEVDDRAVVVTAGGEQGCLHAVQTLRQLLPPAVHRRAWIGGGLVLPSCRIDDAPALGWRGLMLDVARHFLPKHRLLDLVEVMAVHKLNRLQLHLTDDQGWRIESRRFPRLHQIGATRWRTQRSHFEGERVYDETPHGGYYTHDDLREIVAHAADHGIDVVPEIELPGHTSALLAAHPEHGVPAGVAGDVRGDWGIHPALVSPMPETMAFLRAVLDEVVEVFPGPWVHVGGDESLVGAWERDPTVAAYVRSLGLDARGMFGRFLRDLADHLAARDRTMVTWDDAFAADPDAELDAVVMAWRGTAVARRAAARGRRVVLAPVVPTYLDYDQSDDPREPLAIGGPITFDDVANFDPRPSAWPHAERSNVLGAQCQLWTEFVPDSRAVDYQLFPRLCAFAEVAWSGAPAEPAELRLRMAHHLERLDALGVEYRPLDGPRPWQEGGTGARRRHEGGWSLARIQSMLAAAAEGGEVAFSPPDER